MAYTQLRIAVLLLSCFVFFTHLVYGAPIQMANNAWKFTTNLEPLPSQTENSQLKFSTDEIQDARHKVRDISSTDSPEMMTNATFAQMTTSVELVAIDDQYNTTDLTTITPSSEAASTKNLIESTDQPLQVTEKQNIISESSSVINQINATSQTSSNLPDLSTSKDLITSQSTNIMTLTTTSSSETVTEKTTKEQDKVTKATDATISTTIESFAFHPIVVPDDINTSQNTEIPLVTAEIPTDPTKDTIDKSTEFAVVDDLKGTTAFVSTVTVTAPMTESHKSTIAEEFSSLTQTLSSLAHSSQTTNSELISTAKTNEINESPKTSDFFSSSQTLASMADASQTTNSEQVSTTKIYERNESPQTSEIFSSSQTLASMADASQTTKSEQISTAKTSEMNESPKTSDFFSSFQTSPSMADASKITNSEQISTTKMNEMNESPKTSDFVSSAQTLPSMADAGKTTNTEQIFTTKMNESPKTSDFFSSSQTWPSVADTSKTETSEQISTTKINEMNESPKTSDLFSSFQTLASMADASQTTNSVQISTTKMYERNESPQTSEIFSSSQTLASMTDASQTTNSEEISTAKTSEMNESPKTFDFFSSSQTLAPITDASQTTDSEHVSTPKMNEMNESPSKTSDYSSSTEYSPLSTENSKTTSSEQVSAVKMNKTNESTTKTSEFFSWTQHSTLSPTTNSEQISIAKMNEMNESPTKTSDLSTSREPSTLMASSSQSSKFEQISADQTTKMNELNESSTQLLVSDSTLRASELSYIPVETIVSDVFNMTSPNQSLKELHLWSSPEPDRTINVSSETTITTATSENPTSELPEKLDINEITEVSKATQSPVHSEQTKLMSTDALTNKNFEKNEIDKSTTLYVPIRKDYTSLLRRKTNPMTEAPSHQNIVTEQTPKTSKKHLNVWVADLKVPDGDVDFTSIPRNPTSTMYPTLMNVNLPATAANSVVSRRAGYLNNIPPIQQDVEKLPSSTNPVRASNPGLTDTFPNHSILDISSTIPAYSSTTFFDQFNVVTTPISLTTRDTHTTPAQENDRKMQNTSLNSDDSQILPKNITAELTKLIEKDVLPLSPSLIQQMRLVDDAIKEEFMKEMALSLNKKLASLNKTTRDNANNEYMFTTTTAPNNISEKSRNLTLYKVNPNYKPLKRLEIQPSKQFTIDPDDNSWRNESINSRGVVFKANNSTIVFSQVLKNKTEAELNNTKLWNKDSKEEQPELRERLEKLAEKRKYKKKYNTSSIFTDEVEDLTTTEQPEPIELKPVNKISRPSSTTIDIPTFNKDDEAYESNDDDDEQLSKLSHLDLLKSSPNPIEPVATYFPPNRKGTIQYFPPRKSVDQIKYNINFFATENNVPVSTVTVANDDALTTSPPRIEPPKGRKSLEPYDPKWRKEPESEIEEPPQGAYIIKHYRDFLRHATGDIGYERKGLEDYNPHSEVLNKIVEDLNNNSEQFKAEFPVLYNTSIEHGGSAASRTYVRRLHEPRSRETRPGSYLAHTKRYDPSCENLTVELNPAYELHYYVPDQEERQDPAPVEAYHFDNL